MRQILFWFLLYILFTNTSFANIKEWCLGSNNFLNFNNECNNKVGFEMYECRVTNLCNPCIGDNPKKIFKTEEYPDADELKSSRRLASFNVLDPFYKVQDIYVENMNSIYKCVLIDIQERWLEYLEQIISATDKTWLVKKELQTKIWSEKTKIKAKKASLKCTWWWEDSSDETLIKKEVLEQTSLEFCKYSYYLLYLKEYYTINKNLLWITDEEIESDTSWDTENEGIKINEVSSWSYYVNKTIDEELIRINKVFPLAYYAYSEYEDNYVLHLMLTLIKQDFVIARDQLAKVLWPINQVAYKIKDAMKKY